MKGLLKYLSPFAPDQSGAAAVLYELGGMIVICDAGGCTGNICGFDEPRWFLERSGIFSAGLRDMDAILGRDQRLVEKIGKAAERLKPAFIALFGTPVPAVIGTDFRALERMTEKTTGLPVITVECTGTRLYDRGEADTWLALFKKFAEDPEPGERTAVGVIGMTPLNISMTSGKEMIRSRMKEKVICYGMGDGLEAVKRAGQVSSNLVVGPSGIKAARYLEARFGTPWSMDYPFLSSELREKLQKVAARKVLVIHQQAAANALRREICQNSSAFVTVATWFLQDPAFREEQDVVLETEEDLRTLVEKEKYDLILGDPVFKRVLRDYKGEWMDAVHFAVSGSED